eukprot:8105363-Karenia_brevis.AAC.1
MEDSDETVGIGPPRAWMEMQGQACMSQRAQSQGVHQRGMAGSGKGPTGAVDQPYVMCMDFANKVKVPLGLIPKPNLPKASAKAITISMEKSVSTWAWDAAQRGVGTDGWVRKCVEMQSMSSRWQQQ